MSISPIRRYKNLAAKGLWLTCLMGLIAILPSEMLLTSIASIKPSNSRSFAAPGSHCEARADIDGAIRSRAERNYGKMPLRFEANHGQADGAVRFTARASNYSLLLNPKELVLIPGDLEVLALGEREKEKSPGLRMRLIGANASARAYGVNELESKSNYIIGNDTRRWRTNISNYAGVMCEQVYPGIDAVYYGNRQEVEYDFKVAAGADPGRIRLAFVGAKEVSKNRAGELVIETSAGVVRQRKPVAYQMAGGERKQVESRFRITKKNVVSFRVGRYDRRKPLVIDPVLVYSSLIGGGSTDSGRGIAVDSTGAAYVTGKTDSANFPVTADASQSARGGNNDIFIVKMNQTGTAVEYSTYLGGSDEEAGRSIAVDPTGAVYVTGETRSNDFPTTPGSVQTQGGGLNAFVVKISSNGSLAYSTYLGRSLDFTSGGVAEGFGIAVDSTGAAYVTGRVAGNIFPTTEGAYQRSYGGSAGDAFVTKLNPAGTALVYSTYLGGSGFEIAQAIAVDSKGAAYVTGFTSFSDTTFPRTQGAFQTEFGGGAQDAFVTKLNPSGTALVYSTLLGGDIEEGIDGNETGFGIAVDPEGNAYVTGVTGSKDFPTTRGAFQTEYGGGRFGGDAFVTKLNPKGTALVYSTYLGGADQDIGRAIAIDQAGNAYITGSSLSNNFPAAAPLQRKSNSGPAFRSTDGGSTWVEINEGLISPRVTALVIDPQSPSTLYAGTDNGLFKSTNSGNTWSAANTGLSGSLGIGIFAIAIDPQRPSTLYAGLISGIFKSTDGGESWASTPLNALVTTLAIDPASPSNIYAGVTGYEGEPGAGIFKSTDAGNSWNPVNTGLNIPPPPPPRGDPMPPFEVMAMVIDPASPTTIYISAGFSGVYKSSDGGARWTGLRNGFRGINTTALAIDARASLLYAGDGGGVIKSADGGINWVTLNGGLPGTVYRLALDPNSPSTLYGSFIGPSNFGGLFKSTDGGNNWGRTGLSNLSITSLAIDPQNPDTIYAGTSSQSVRSDAFVAKLSRGGAALIYSTYLGGHSDDSGLGVAVDSANNLYVTGETSSANFQTTAGAFNAASKGGISDTFLAKLTSQFAITGASIKGKKLIVTGDNFGKDAVIIVDGEQQKTKSDLANPGSLLIAKKSGKKIAEGQEVTIQVRNPDGALTEGFRFTRSPQ